MKRILIILFCVSLINCQQEASSKSTYVIEITTFKYKSSVNLNDFWNEDAKIETQYTSKQKGFISRESAYSNETNEVLVLVKWDNEADADASMKKFMADTSVKKYVNMIDGATMSMNRYIIK